MAGKNNDLLDNDFIDEGETDFIDTPEDGAAKDSEGIKRSKEVEIDVPSREERWSEVKKPQKDPKAPEVVVDIADDTPEKDRGKWVADDNKDGPPEDLDEKEIRNYAKDAQKRIGKVTARMHAERRAREDKERQYNEAVALAKRLLSENNELKNVVEGGERVLMGEHKGRLEGQLNQAKAAYREASEAGDTNGMIAAQELIARSVAQIERLSGHRPAPLPREDESIFAGGSGQNVQSQTQEVKPSERAQAWRKKNPWFDKDVAMQAFALGVHKQLVEFEGVEADSEDYYKAIDTEVRKRFSDRFRSAPSPERRGPPPVAQVSRGGSAQPRRVTLTESQARLAKRLGLTPQQYAEQLIAEERNHDDRDFTHSSRR